MDDPAQFRILGTSLRRTRLPRSRAGLALDGPRHPQAATLPRIVRVTRNPADRGPLRADGARARGTADPDRPRARRTRSPGVVGPWPWNLRRGRRIRSHPGNLDTSLFQDAGGHAAVSFPPRRALRPAHGGAVPPDLHEHLVAR